MIDCQGNIKMIDFGFAKVLHQSQQFRTSTNCGTLGYTAPEVILGSNQGYSFQIDIWSFGILLCELIQGGLPFNDIDDPMIIQQQTIQGDIKMPRDID